MNHFEKAFNRERSPGYKRGGRQLNDIGNLLNTGLPQYVIYYTAAQQSYNNQNLPSALDLIDKAIYLSDIDDWKQFAFKANVLEDMQRYSDAIKQYEIAIDISTNDVDVYALYHQVGVCYLNLGYNEKAVEFYTYSIELKKQHPNSQFNPDNEGMDLGVMLGIPLKRMYNNRGNALANIGQLHQAFDDATTAIDIDPDYSNPYVLMSLICSKYGREEQSLELLKIAAQKGNSNAQRMLAQLGYR